MSESLRDMAISMGSEHVQWLIEQRKANRKLTTHLKECVEDWATECDIEMPEALNPDELTFWFARVYLQKVANQ